MSLINASNGSNQKLQILIDDYLFIIHCIVILLSILLNFQLTNEHNIIYLHVVLI